MGVRREHRHRQPAHRPRLLHARRRTRTRRSARSASRPTAAARRSSSSPTATRSTRASSRQAPTASCVANEAAALGLQHDVEASPKGRRAPEHLQPVRASRGDAQIIIDATDAAGPLPRPGAFGGVGLRSACPRQAGRPGDHRRHRPGEPAEIGLTSHIGEAHTVNSTPSARTSPTRSPPTARAVDDEGKRGQRDRAARRALDGFEVVDLSSCMNFPAGHVDRPRSARAAGRRSSATASRRVAMSRGPHDKGVDLRLPRARGLSRRPPDLRQRPGADGLRHERRLRRPRHARRLHRRQAARHAAAVHRCARASSAGVPDRRAMVTDCVDGAGEGDGRPHRVEVARRAARRRSRACSYLGIAFHMGRSRDGDQPPPFDSTRTSTSTTRPS